MKILYSFPAFLYYGFMTLIGMSLGIGSFEPEAWIYAFLLLMAAVLLSKNKWWGCVPGMAVGGIIVYLFETTSAHQHINITPLGIGIVLYFAAMGVICYKLSRMK